MLLRDETKADHAAIEALISAAFLEAPHRDGNEAVLVARLRDAGALLLSILAEDNGAIAGHIAASPCRIDGAEGFALIAPVAVAPERQGQGIGGELVHAALERLSASGVPGVVLVGDPGWYGRFGFVAREGLSCPGIPAEYVLSRGLTGAAPVGELGLHPAFTSP